jgi:hypothetical protein
VTLNGIPCRKSIRLATVRALHLIALCRQVIGRYRYNILAAGALEVVVFSTHQRIVAAVLSKYRVATLLAFESSQLCHSY